MKIVLKWKIYHFGNMKFCPHLSIKSLSIFFTFVYINRYQCIYKKLLKYFPIPCILYLHVWVTSIWLTFKHSLADLFSNGPKEIFMSTNLNFKILKKIYKGISIWKNIYIYYFHHIVLPIQTFTPKIFHANYAWLNHPCFLHIPIVRMKFQLDRILKGYFSNLNLFKLRDN